MFHKPRKLLPTCKEKGSLVQFYWYLQVGHSWCATVTARTCSAFSMKHLWLCTVIFACSLVSESPLSVVPCHQIQDCSVVTTAKTSKIPAILWNCSLEVRQIQEGQGKAADNRDCCLNRTCL
mmetsp:Transcript_53898/g.126400  ORF Transcript_53898/g.126400 Transcript_53898/m.126400 type:complete len:122 (-) Transcript_53898:990-1355(-)